MTLRPVVGGYRLACGGMGGFGVGWCGVVWYGMVCWGAPRQGSTPGVGGAVFCSLVVVS